MTTAKKLEALIQKAIDGGWDCFGTDLTKWDWHVGEGRIYPLYMYHTPNESVGMITYTSLNYDVYRIIFNHDFARALFGEGYEPADEEFEDKDDYRMGATGYRQYTTIHDQKVWDSRQSGWQYHLQQAVIAVDPVDYMYGVVFEENKK